MGCRANKSRCLTHDLWEELGNQIHIFLSSVSLADVCSRRVLGQGRILTAAESEHPAMNAPESQGKPTSGTPTPVAAE
jgi:Rrf2 family iron-sulfur cluster assembly transcriptional regulator